VGERSGLSEAASIIDVVEEALNRYNKYRSPEATAELAGVSGDTIKVIFKGSFKNTCGFIDWIEDLRYILEDYGVDSCIEEIRETEDGAVALFRVKSINLEKKN